MLFKRLEKDFDKVLLQVFTVKNRRNFAKLNK